jgi:hypothetical protein
MGVRTVNNNTNDAWDDFLSNAAQTNARDEASTEHVLKALRLERQENPAWNAYLSSATTLRPVDMAVVQPALQAVKLERKKTQVLRLNITRAVAGFAAAAAVAAGFVLLSPSASADPSEAYSVYQEASTGW